MESVVPRAGKLTLASSLLAGVLAEAALAAMAKSLLAMLVLACVAAGVCTLVFFDLELLILVPKRAK